MPKKVVTLPPFKYRTWWFKVVLTLNAYNDLKGGQSVLLQWLYAS